MGFAPCSDLSVAGLERSLCQSCQCSWHGCFSLVGFAASLLALKKTPAPTGTFYLKISMSKVLGCVGSEASWSLQQEHGARSC